MEVNKTNNTINATNSNTSKNVEAKKEDDKDIKIPFNQTQQTDDEKKKAEYEEKRSDLITQIKNLNEEVYGVSIADDAVIYQLSNEELAKDLENLQQQKKSAQELEKNAWWNKLSNWINNKLK